MMFREHLVLFRRLAINVPNAYTQSHTRTHTHTHTHTLQVAGVEYLVSNKLADPSRYVELRVSE